MSDEIIVSSTTDTQQAVNEAAAQGDGELLEGAAKEKVLPERPALVRSTTDPPEAVAEVEKDLAEEREQRKEEYLGKTKRKLMRKVSALQGEVHQLREELEQHRPQQPQNGEAYFPADTSQQAGKRLPANPQPAQPQQAANEQQVWQQWKEQQQRLPQMVEEAKQKYADYDEVVSKADRETPVSATAALTIGMLPNAPDVAYYISKHPEVVARLWALETTGQGQQAFALLNGISYHITQNGGQPQQRRGQVRSAPEPIRPVTGGTGKVGWSINDDDIPYSEYRKLRNNEERRRR